MAAPIAATITSRTFDRVSIAYVKTASGPSEAGRVYVRDELDYGYWYVWGLLVKPPYRRQGIGRQLMDEIIGLYGYDRMELIPGMDKASFRDGMDTDHLIAWYMRLGFAIGPSANTEREPRPSDERRMFRKGARGI
jgi:ribosomal protein S18 acetylase RimI-like enzyme